MHSIKNSIIFALQNMNQFYHAMKKTFNVNIGSISFVIDEDAYYMLRKYLDDVGARFEPVEAAETLNDLEMRIADIFSENLSSVRQVVNTELVRKTINILGRADEFGEPRTTPRDGHADIKKLRRSRTNRVIGGVCGGLANYFGIDVSVVRILMFLLIFFGGISLWVYLILWIAIPSEP